MSGAAEYLTGRVGRILFRAPENDYTVFVLDTGAEQVTVVGILPELRPGDQVRVGGRWVQHPRYGRQFRAETLTTVLPTTEEEIIEYLASGLFRGVGPKTARRIVEAFGTAALEVLEKEPDRLLEVRGIAEKKKEQILESFAANRHQQQTVMELQRFGVGISLAMKLYRQYGVNAPQVLRENPYRLVKEVWGVGFKTADRIARAAGISSTAPVRLAAVLQYLLTAAANRDGHVYLEAAELVDRALELLNPEGEDQAYRLRERLEAVLAQLAAAGQLVRIGSEVYLPHLYRAEQETAALLARLLRNRPQLGLETAAVAAQLPRVAEDLGLELAPEQEAAIKTALAGPVTVITGGPGTGKTTIVRGIIATLERLQANARVRLAAPTGRAAQRLAEVTGLNGQTLHRLLECTFLDGQVRFTRHAQNPLEGDLLIVDESSMIDTLLACALLRAVPPGMQLVLVGDADQLPPVGPGDFLRQVIAAGVLPVVRLTRIFRQQAASDIVVHAHQINQGVRPRFRVGSDVEFIRAESAATAAERVVQLVRALVNGQDPGGLSAEGRVEGRPEQETANTAPLRAGAGPVEVQVITPMHRGPAGVAELNRRLQAVLNPPRGGPELVRGGVTYRPGDRVICLKNNYQKGIAGIFNGTIGQVEQVITADESDTGSGHLIINFEGERVVYSQDELEELGLAYAMTVHKAQGSEFPVVVLVLTTEHYIMLYRNLLYTAYTRARDRLYIVGSPRALHLAVKRTRTLRRHTRLARRLQDEVTGK